MQGLDIQLINLDGSDNRLASAAAALAQAGLTFRRMPAFDGRKTPPEDLPLYDAREAMRMFGRKLTGAEVACFLSHLEAARRFLESGRTYGLVFEDDVAVPEDAKQVLEMLLAALDGRSVAHPWWLINLGAPPSRFFSPMQQISKKHALFRAHFFPVLATAILWNREGAARFVGEARSISLPLDHWLRNWATAADRGLALAPPLFHASGASSDIDSNVSRSKSVRRGLRYALSRKLWLWRNMRLAQRHLRQHDDRDTK